MLHAWIALHVLLILLVPKFKTQQALIITTNKYISVFVLSLSVHSVKSGCQRRRRDGSCSTRRRRRGPALQEDVPVQHTPTDIRCTAWTEYQWSTTGWFFVEENRPEGTTLCKLESADQNDNDPGTFTIIPHGDERFLVGEGTQLTGPNINGSPVLVTLKLGLGNNEWVVGAVNGGVGHKCGSTCGRSSTFILW